MRGLLKAAFHQTRRRFAPENQPSLGVNPLEILEETRTRISELYRVVEVVLVEWVANMVRFETWFADVCRNEKWQSGTPGPRGLDAFPALPAVPNSLRYKDQPWLQNKCTLCLKKLSQ